LDPLAFLLTKQQTFFALKEMLQVLCVCVSGGGRRGVGTSGGSRRWGKGLGG
jgi:hypothetical protein